MFLPVLLAFLAMATRIFFSLEVLFLHSVQFANGVIRKGEDGMEFAINFLKNTAELLAYSLGAVYYDKHYHLN